LQFMIFYQERDSGCRTFNRYTDKLLAKRWAVGTLLIWILYMSSRASSVRQRRVLSSMIQLVYDGWSSIAMPNFGRAGMNLASMSTVYRHLNEEMSKRALLRGGRLIWVQPPSWGGCV